MKAIKTAFSGKRIGYPKIGAGLAGGDWDIIYPIICEELAGEHHTLWSIEGLKPKYLFFWGHTPSPTGEVTKSCLSQWYDSPFTVDGLH
jgi:O-acetyl-ADP-ribose deacetylase (regulator of RNase III)